MPKSPKSLQPAESRTPEELADAAALHAGMMAAVGDDLAALSALLATKTDATLFGDTEFQVRDLVHAIGAKAIQAAADTQKSELRRLLPILPYLRRIGQVPTLAAPRAPDDPGRVAGRAAVLLLQAVRRRAFAAGRGAAVG